MVTYLLFQSPLPVNRYLINLYSGQVYLYYTLSKFKLVVFWSVFYRKTFKEQTNIFLCEKDIVTAAAFFSILRFYFMPLSNIFKPKFNHNCSDINK